MTALDNSVSSISLSLLSVKDLMKRKSCLPIGECRLFTAKRLKIACNATVSSSKYAKKIPKNSHRTESKYSKHTALSTNRKLPAGRTNNILRSANSSSVDVNKTSVVNTDLQQRCAKAAVVNLCLDKNVALNSHDETTKSSTSSSHESGSSRQDDTPEVFGIRLDSKIQIESLNESDVCTVIKNKTGISRAAMSSTECTKLACGSTPHVNALAKNRKTEDILCMEPPKFTDMNTHFFQSQKSAPSIESGKKSDANNEMESLITPNENNTSKTQENAHLQKLPTNKDDFSSQNLQMDLISTKKTNIDSLFRVKTISSKELARYLSHYNLTLKAVSIAGKTTNQVNEKSNEIQSTHTETTDDSQLISISADTNTKRSAFAVNNKHRLANNNPLATIALSCVGDTVFRTTRQGTFSNWKIGGTRCAKHFAYTKARASSYTERLESGRMKDRKKIHATTQYGTQFKHNRWKLSDTSCFQSQIKMFPLSNAFHDLAARDKATKQTLENSKIQNNLWPLSPTMHNLMNDSNPTETSGLQSDPMLTSAVPQDKNEDDFIAESDLELSRDSLSYSESMEKSNSNLNDFGSSQSQSDGFTTKSADESSDICPSSFYDFSDIGDKIPDVNLKPGLHISHGPESNDLQSAFLTKLENNGTSSDGSASNAKCDVLKIKACRNTSSETTSYLHCYTDECVNSANQCTSEKKNTKTENLKISDYSGNLVLDDIKKPVEDLNSKEVDLESKKLGIDRTLRSLPLNKLRKQFGDDSLARHLYQKIQKLAADKRTTAKARNKSNKGMYRRTGQCAFLSPPVVPVTSAEQLEESVNFEDLLGFDNISGSLEFTDDYGGNESMLCTFESECQQPPASHQLACYSSGVSWSHFNLPGNRKNSHAQQEDENLHQEPLRSPPPLLSFAGNCYTTDHAHNIYGEEMIVTTHCHQNSSPSPSSIPTANNRPVSPSTFYNLPPVTSTPVFTETNMRSDNSGVTPCPNIHAARSPVVACIREPTMSDTDSGIHSPDSTPNKYVNASAATFTVETRPPFNGQDNSNGYLCAEAGARQEFLWMGENENFVSTNFENKMGNKLYLTAEESTATLLSSNNIESNQESCKSCSTLSNSSSLSVGESQTKLFNMDDCKTYIANGPLHSSYSKKYVLKEEANLFNSTMNRPVFVSVSENNTANMSATKAPQRMAQESSKKRPAVFTNGNITTLYPSFVPHNRNSSAVSRDDNASRFQKRTESSALKTYNATIKSRIKREHFSQIGSGRSHGQRQTSDDSDDTLIDSFDIKIRRSSAGKSAHLWEFIRDTLLNPLYCPRLIKWENREAGIFRFVQSDVVAGMWGEKKNNPKMTYEKLSRAMRYYYNREILERVDGRRLVYKFGKNAYGWRLSEKTQEKNTKKGSLFEEELHPQGGQTLSRNLSSNCKNAEKSTDDNLHSPVKRRRVSSKGDEALSSTKEQSTGRLKTPATTVGLNANIAKECVRLTGVKRKSRDDNHQTEKSNTTSTVKKQQKTPRSSCIVYLARPTRLSDFTENGSENNVFKAQVGEWPSEERSVTPSSSLQSKLPSAEVLLGKQYKIATVA